ncbi:MAG: IS3 family transposase [Verrucomicrobiales bacterium]|nr:IS3 family transposase [Verrucomicrobiales bacterium]
MSPGHKRQVAEGFVEKRRCTQRQACRYFRLHRSSMRYEAREPDAWMMRLRAAVRCVSGEHSQREYTKITRLLQDEGWQVGKRVVQQLRREIGLRVPKRKPKRRRRGTSTGLPTTATHRGHVWTWDFVHDRTVRGGRLKMLTIVDELTRENHLIHVDRRIRPCDVRRQLERLMDIHGAPEHIRRDNGSEFIHGELQAWLKEAGIKTLYIDPGSPWQNGFIESLHSRFRAECLDREQLWTLSEARVVIEDWRREYNEKRPHRSLGLETPRAFAMVASQAAASGRATPSLRPQLDISSLVERYSNPNTNPTRLTFPVGQFG